MIIIRFFCVLGFLSLSLTASAMLPDEALNSHIRFSPTKVIATVVAIKSLGMGRFGEHLSLTLAVKANLGEPVGSGSLVLKCDRYHHSALPGFGTPMLFSPVEGKTHFLTADKNGELTSLTLLEGQVDLTLALETKSEDVVPAGHRVRLRVAGGGDKVEGLFSRKGDLPSSGFHLPVKTTK